MLKTQELHCVAMVWFNKQYQTGTYTIRLLHYPYPDLVYILLTPLALHTLSLPNICSRIVLGLLLSPSAPSQYCAINNTPEFVQILESGSEIMVKLTIG